MEYSTARFLYTAAIKLCDVLTVLAVWYGCWYLRFLTPAFPITKGIPSFDAYRAVSLPLMAVFFAVFHLVGAYRKDRIVFGFRAFKKMVEGAAFGTLVFIATLYFQGAVTYSRIYLVLFAALLIPALLAERAILEAIWRTVQRHAIRRLRLLAVGSGELIEMYIRTIDQRRPYPVQWVGRVGERTESAAALPYLGDTDRLLGLIEKEHVDRIILSYPSSESAKYEPILRALSNELVEIKVLPDFGRFSTFTYHAGQECGIPLLEFNQTPVGATDRALKRTLDIAGSLGFLLVCAPLYLVIAVLIKLTSRGPIFYKQERVGADGRAFALYKFRSMIVDAETATGAVWATANDDRTTRLGKWLRRTSLDEIPQFYNVLRGDMSLVGPRPERPVFVSQFRKEIPKYMLRHRMKSGITGWAQVNGWRGNTDLQERIKCDLFYIGHWSHFFDIKILVLTLFRGFVNKNAY